MASPTQSDVHLDAILTQLSVAYIQGEDKFMSREVFPLVPVDKQSDKFYVYNKGDWFRDEAEKRADSTESVGSGYRVGTNNYFCDVYAFHKDVGDQVRANVDNPLDVDRDATAFVTQRMLLRQEIQWVSDYFTTGVWTTDKTGGSDFTVWSDYAASDPIEDIEAAKSTMLSTTGFEPNTLVLGYDVFRRLKNHPDIVDRMKYTSAANITTDILARMLEIDRILVAKAIKNTAVETATNDLTAGTFSFTHGKHAWLGYVAPSPGLLQPSAGYQFVWKGVSEGLGTNVGISRFRMDHLRADRIEAQMAWDNKVIAADLGYFFSGAVS